MFRRLFFFLLILAGPTIGPAQADFDASRRWYEALDEEARYLVQADLVLVGLYDRFIDGEFGAGTYEGLRRYDQRSGSSDGVLTPRQMQSLQNESAVVFDRHGFRDTKDQTVGLGLFIPHVLLPEDRPTSRGHRYSRSDGGLVLETIRKPLSEQSFERLFAQLATTTAGRRVTYSVLDDSVFVVSGMDGTASFYTRFFKSGDASVGFSLTWSQEQRSLGPMVSIMLANFSYPLAKEREEEDRAAPDGTDGPETSSGSGFLVSDKGLVVTNFHVAGNCSSITIPGYGKGRLVKGDEAVDLAAVEIDTRLTTPWVSIREEPPKLGEEVVLVGFPLASLLNSSLNVATGIVSAETGLAGEDNWFTTNAGIQPGNSGGPVLDRTGSVVGVAVAKIDDAKLLQAIGNTAPNIGFAIDNSVLLDFLAVFQHSRSTGEGSELSVQQLAMRAKDFTVQVICER